MLRMRRGHMGVSGWRGFDSPRRLDGGLAAWRASGRPTEGGDHRSVPAGAFGAPFPARPDLVVNAAEVRSLLGRRDAIVVSVRSRAEQEGRASGYRDPANPVATGPLRKDGETPR